VRAVIFPGQGSQAVGMGKTLAEASAAARAVFEAVDEALGQNLSRLMWEGPEDDLTLTENAQPALMAASLATVRALEAEGGFTLGDKFAYTAGHSLGEYSALCAAGVVGLADTARLLKIRGRAMQKAVPVGAGAMAALLGLDYEAAAGVATDAAGDGVCQAANDNAPGQVVISGDVAAVDRAILLAKERGAKRAMRLEVSAPFHCALMQPAADAMAEALDSVTFAVPAMPVVSNVKAAPVRDPAELKSLLVAQITGMVRWRESVGAMGALGVDTLVELGAGKVLTGLARRIDREMTALNAGTPEEIAALLETL